MWNHLWLNGCKSLILTPSFPTVWTVRLVHLRDLTLTRHRPCTSLTDYNTWTDPFTRKEITSGDWRWTSVRGLWGTVTPFVSLSVVGNEWQEPLFDPSLRTEFTPFLSRHQWAVLQRPWRTSPPFRKNSSLPLREGQSGSYRWDFVFLWNQYLGRSSRFKTWTTGRCRYEFPKSPSVTPVTEEVPVFFGHE